MTQLAFVFPKPPPPALRDAFVDKLRYCSEDIVGFAERGDAVELAVREGCDEAAVRDKVERFYRSLARGFFPAAAERTVDHLDRAGAPAATLADLIAARWFLPYADGCIGMQGPALALLEYFDRTFRGLAERRGAAEATFPTLIALDTLQRASYVASFPHHLTLAARLAGDYDGIQRFVAAAQGDRAAALRECAPPDHVLSPTVCIHCYAALAGRRLAAGERVMVTVRGNCFRHELGRLDHGARLWDFHMREIISVGAPAAVEGDRADAMAEVCDWLDELELGYAIEGAHDPFFVDSFSSQYFFQLAHKTKYELRMPIPGGSLAAGSFNTHRDFFGNAFDLACGDGPAHTSCSAIGLERIVYAFVCQHGMRPERWPVPVTARAPL